MAKLGFIGLGVMGSQMVNRLLSKGHIVTGYNRTRAKAQWLVEKVKALLLDIGPKVTYVGDNGLALSMKIAVNLSLAVQMLAFSEGVLLAEKSGIARETAVDVLIHSAIASPMIQYRGPFVLQQPEEAWFDVNMMQKDMVLAMDLGRQLDVPLPSTAVSNEILTAARGMGWTKYDFACMFDVLAAMSGVTTPVTAGGKKTAGNKK